MALAEVHLGVFRIRVGLKARVRFHLTGCPFPDVAHHMVAAKEGTASRKRADWGRTKDLSTEVGVMWLRWVVAPRKATREPHFGVPGSSLLPLGFGWQSLGYRARIGARLVPRNVLYGSRRNEWLHASKFDRLPADLRAPPAERVFDLMLCTPRPALFGPPFTSLVAAPVEELEKLPGCHRRGIDPEGIDVHPVGGAFVVVGVGLSIRAHRK